MKRRVEAKRRKREEERRRKEEAREARRRREMEERKKALVETEHGIVDGAFVESRYEVLEKLGDGNFADVYRCKERASGTAYALKTVYKNRLVGRRERAMIANEVAILKSVGAFNRVVS